MFWGWDKWEVYRQKNTLTAAAQFMEGYSRRRNHCDEDLPDEAFAASSRGSALSIRPHTTVENWQKVKVLPVKEVDGCWRQEGCEQADV